MCEICVDVRFENIFGGFITILGLEEKRIYVSSDATFLGNLLSFI